MVLPNRYLHNINYSNGKKMNKVLTSILIIGTCYLAYDSYSNNEKVSLEEVATVDKNALNIADVPEIEEPAFENNLASLDGVYSLYLKSDLAETNQEFSFQPNGSFTLRRYVIEPKNDGRDSSTTGTYTVEKNKVFLNFEQKRDIDVFPEPLVILKVKRNGNLVYGVYEVKKN